jgi:glycosyltransferase involved in cell wall biosynthesis
MGNSRSQKIKVCHIVDALNIGGLEKNLISIIQRTPQFEHAVWCLREKGVLARILEEQGIKVIEYNFSGRLRLKLIGRLAEEMRKQGFAIVHCHGLYPSIWGRAAGWLAGVRVRLAHVQNMYYGIRLWQRIKLKLLSGITSRFIAVSEAVRKCLIEEIWIAPRRITVVYNSSEDIRAKDKGQREIIRRELGFNSQDVVVGNIGRIEEHKGHQFIIEAIAECRKKQLPCKGLILGNGPAKPGLEQSASQLGLKEQVVFLEARQNIEEVLLACDIFVQPSTLREGLPLALAEAASSGLALIATDVGGNAEIVRDGWNGFVVPVKDSSVLAQKIGYLAEHLDQRKVFGQNSRALWQEKFRDTLMAEKIAGIYIQETIKFSRAAGDPPYRVLYLHETSWISGAENSLLQLVTHLDRTRFEPVFVLPEQGPLWEQLNSLGVEVYLIDFPKIRYCLGVNKSLRSLEALIKEKNIRIIHSNSIRTHIYGFLAARKSRVPTVWHQRNMLRGEILDPDRLFMGWADRIICNSQAVARRFESGGRIPDKVKVVFNGVDTARFAPEVDGSGLRQEFGIGLEETVIGICSRFNLQKGHETFFKAATLVLSGDAGQRKRWRFLIAGGAVFGSDKPREEYLKNLVRKLKIEDRVVFIGFRQDMPRVYAAMDILVLASQAEACGRVVLEAMASAKPVIATSSGGTPEMIQDGLTGMLFKSGDYRDLAGKIITLGNAPLLANKIGQSARAKIENDLKIERNVAGIQDIYEELVN